MTHRGFGMQVKKIRKSKFIKKDDMAKSLGISYQEYTNIERGRKEVDAVLRKKLEEALEIKFDIQSFHSAA